MRNLDIEGFISRRFGDYGYYGSPVSDIKIDCPFCGDSKQHLHIGLDKPVTHCFRCGYSSSWVTFVMAVTGLPYFRAIGELYVPSKLVPDLKGEIEGSWDRTEKDKIIIDYKLPYDFELLKEHQAHTRLVADAKRYLLYRGIGVERWNKYRLGVSEEIGYRIVIPIEYGYWQGRAIYKWLKPKYINPKTPAREVIFNSKALVRYPEVVICEGAFSAMAVGDNAVALISKEATTEKIERLADSPVTSFIIAQEPGAFPTMGKIAEALYRAGKKVTIWSYAIGDPADPAGMFEAMEYDLKSRLKLMMSM